MKTSEQIEQALRDLELQTRSATDERILTDAEAALPSAAGAGVIRPAPAFGKRIVTNPWFVLGTAAAALFAVVAGIQFFGAEKPLTTTTSSTETVALKDTKQEAIAIGTPEDLIPKIEPVMVELKLELPKPSFYSVPFDFSKVDRLEPPRKAPRESILVPEGTKIFSLGKTVTSSNMQLNVDTLAQIIDGDKEGGKSSIIELGSGIQWIQVDLDRLCNIYAIIFWHFHRYPRVYFDVAVQVSKDPDFVEATTLFNSDHNNSLGLGVGKDLLYIDTYEGKLLDAKGVRARYVRLYSNGNNNNDLNHYTEVEVYGVNE